jgi:hypothetical protein
MIATRMCYSLETACAQPALRGFAEEGQVCHAPRRTTLALADASGFRNR